MSAVVKRSVSINGHRTSVSLEQPFFDELAEMAAERHMPLARLIGEVDSTRPRDANLSSALRVFVLQRLREGREAG